MTSPLKEEKTPPKPRRQRAKKQAKEVPEPEKEEKIPQVEGNFLLT